MSRPLGLEVRGARTHNLRSVDCTIPHGRVTVVTGVSGAGKSSLVFDTVYAEAQRRFIESMSPYVRQFLEQMERGEVESLDNVLPAIALEAKNSIRNSRSTVGTLTEVHDLLRLIYAHLGEVSCSRGHGAEHVAARGPQQLASHLIESFGGRQVTLVAALPRPARNANVKLAELVRQGYFRRLDGHEILRMKPSDRWPVSLDPLLLVLGRFRPEAKNRSRLISVIEEGYMLAAGRLRVLDELGGDLSDAGDGESQGSESDDEKPAWHFFGRGLVCEVCDTRMEHLSPALFSFNSPLGACVTCKGFGRVLGIDPERVIPDPSKSLEERPIAPWNSESRQKNYDRLLPACRAHGIPTNVPVADLSVQQRDFLWRGKGSFTNLDTFFARLERKSYRMHVRILLARYRAYDTCPDCGGDRLKPEALAVRVMGTTLAQLSSMSIEALQQWIQQQWTLQRSTQQRSTQQRSTQQRSTQQQRAEDASDHLLDQLVAKLATLEHVGVGYLTLARQARTLSGGEVQRIQLASALGSGLTGTLYVLDEPTIGLHPQDSDRLLELLRDLARRGNTVLVVEHDRTLIEGADHVIDMGPGAGSRGGEVLVEGDLKTILASQQSVTARFLAVPPPVESREQLLVQAESLIALPRLGVRGARENNLRDFNVEIPLGALVAVTGVSGSGKSTLVENVIYGTYQRSRGVVDVEPGECDALEGFDQVADVVMVDQRPLGRSSRSNPATYVKAYDHIRKVFASTPESKRLGITAGHFSFNVDKGRCPDCKGTGVNEVDMHFMEPVTVVCETCNGCRFTPQVLAVKHRGLTIHEVLQLTVHEAIDEHFADQKTAGHRAIRRKLQALVDVGLGYVQLGQSTSTLSGGEAQRLKLASFLDRSARDERRLFVFDEPTTGLHLADIEVLHATFRRLIDQGHGVLIVEHATDLVARAEWIVDLGPGGGYKGGELLYSGPLLGFLDGVESPTAEVLRQHLGWPMLNNL